MKEVYADIQKLHDQVLITQEVEPLHFDIPPNFTKEVYIQILRKVLACVRHDAYFKIQEVLKRDKKETITKDERDEILEAIYDNKQEEYRAKVF